MRRANHNDNARELWSIESWNKRKNRVHRSQATVPEREIKKKSLFMHQLLNGSSNETRLACWVMNISLEYIFSSSKSDRIDRSILWNNVVHAISRFKREDEEEKKHIFPFMKENIGSTQRALEWPRSEHKLEDELPSSDLISEKMRIVSVCMCV